MRSRAQNANQRSLFFLFRKNMISPNDRSSSLFKERYDYPEITVLSVWMWLFSLAADNWLIYFACFIAQNAASICFTVTFSHYQKIPFRFFEKGYQKFAFKNYSVSMDVHNNCIFRLDYLEKLTSNQSLIGQ